MRIYCILCCVCLLHTPLYGATNSALSDDRLSQIQFQQKIGAKVQPDLLFKDESGTPVRLGDYFGHKPTALILGYYNCPMLCTLVLNGAADCFRNMNWKAGQEFNLIFVSINPNESSDLAAEKKASYVRAYGNNCAGGWHFLSGDQDAITNLARTVGFQYAYDESIKQYAHPSGMVFLTADGRVAKYLLGINFAAKDVDEALRAAAENRTGAPEPQFTLLCFHYAPVHGKYGSLILKIIRGGGIFTILLLAGLFLFPSAVRKREKTK